MTAVRSLPETLPLFPLNYVLMPGARIGLRVFERRYIDLICECGHTSTTFGVILIVNGHEVGEPATPAGYGTEVLIEDFDIGADGLLVLSIRGYRRFCVERTTVRKDGIVVADVLWCAPDQDDELRPEHAFLATLLARMLDQIRPSAGFTGPELLDQASWVGWRLAELLPLKEEQRLCLLQQENPHQRLDQLLAWMN